MVSALDYRSNGPGSSPARGHCVIGQDTLATETGISSSGMGH